MGLLNQSQSSYYTGNDYGNYQFVSLQDVINQFMVAYVGEGKIISKASKTDVSFHAQRAMQELSFDTFKSIKSQEIELPPSLTMILPHDYVNYTCLAFVDNAGIKHRLYPVNKTSNPFSIAQEPDGTYEFSDDVELLLGNSFASAQGRIHPRWKKTHLSNVQRNGNSSAPSGYLGFGGGFNIESDATLEALKFLKRVTLLPLKPLIGFATTALCFLKKLLISERFSLIKVGGIYLIRFMENSFSDIFLTAKG